MPALCCLVRELGPWRKNSDTKTNTPPSEITAPAVISQTNNSAPHLVDPSQLHLNEVVPPIMNLCDSNGFLNDPTTPTRQNANSSAPSSMLRYNSGERENSKRPLSTNVSRIVSSPYSESRLSRTISQMTSTPSTPANEGDDDWSSAVGRATVGGKSGRVIESLQANVDRLKRELKLANMRLEEESKRNDSTRAAFESFRTKHENLVLASETDRAAIARRDRKIEELKADLEAERSRREKAETETKETTRERDEVVGKCRKEVIEEKELAKKSTSQYDILSGSWRSLNDGYSRQTQKLKKDIRDISEKRLEEQHQLARLQVVVEQLSSESEKTRKVNEKVMREFEDYKKEKAEGVRQIRESAEESGRANEYALKEMERVLGEMRYVINVQRNFKYTG
ncbi:hypothetical protein MMC06_000421 [Schaereria dolodes]|nr:hypothetical protein [Schaereria dolodes]